MRRPLQLALILLLAGSLTNLAAKVDFSGTWKANIQKSDFGSLGEPKEFVRTVTEDGLRLIIAVTSTHNGARESGEMRFEINGEESESTVGKTRVKGIARELGDHILLLTRRNWDGVETEILEVWTLGENGKTMTIDAGVITPMGKEELRVVFDKQN